MLELTYNYGRTEYTKGNAYAQVTAGVSCRRTCVCTCVCVGGGGSGSTTHYDGGCALSWYLCEAGSWLQVHRQATGAPPSQCRIHSGEST